MAEREEVPGTEAAGPAETSTAGVAAALAMGLGRKGKGDPELDAFLREQTRLARLQSEHLHEQREIILSRLRWGRFSDRVKALLQVMTVIVGLAVVVLAGSMAWAAHENHGLVVDAFSVPPDMARDGLNGQVAASRFLDKLQAMQTVTAGSDRPAQSFAGDWGSDVKVEIPETGLTFGEFEKLLRERIGQVRHVTGEVVKTPDGQIALTARLGDAAPKTFAGRPGDFDMLAQKAAEAVYQANQPYRYAEYLDDTDRWQEAEKVISELATTGPPSEQGWAYSNWALLELNRRGDAPAAEHLAAKGVGFSPGSDLNAHIAVVNAAVWSGHEETDLRLSKLLDVETQRRLPDTSRYYYEENKLVGRAWMLFVLPDYPGSAAAWRKTLQDGFTAHYGKLAPQMAASAEARAHDLEAARRTMATAAVTDERDTLWDVAVSAFLAAPNYWIAAEAGDWKAAFEDARADDAALEAGKAQRPVYGLMQKVWIWPLEAVAQAKSGDVSGAEALIGKTALDCYPCLLSRGQIAAETKDWQGAERWFAEAVRQAPSVAQGYSDWARVRLDRGDADGAMKLAKMAAERAPKFADPLETWGEALLAKGDFSGAIAKFRETDQFAPHWGRNHLFWGQALARAGRSADARRQFETARRT